MSESQQSSTGRKQLIFDSFFGKGIKMKGTLRFNGNLRFDGKLEGEVITSDTLVVGKDGFIKALVKIGSLLNSGKIDGNIAASKKISVLSNGCLTGNIQTPNLQIEPGARFNGSCDMPENSQTRNTASVNETIHISHDAIHSAPRPKSRKKGSLSSILAILLIISGIVIWAVRSEINLDFFKPFSSEDPNKIIMEGITLRDAGKINEAISIFKKAASMKINDPSSHITLGKAFEAIGIEADAIIEYKKAIEKDPENSKFRSNLLHILIRKGLDDEAIVQLKKLIAINPKDLKSHMELAILFKKKGVEEELYNIYNSIIKIAPNHEKTISNIATLQVARGETGKALASYEKLTEINSDNLDARISMAYIYFSSGYEEKAQSILNKLDDLAPNHFEVENNKGFRFLDQNMTDEAIKVFTKVNRKYKDNIRAQYGIITAFTKKGYYTNAIEECDKALKLTPDIVPMQNRLAWLYGKKNINIEKAIELSQKSIASNPKSPVYLDTLSELYYKNGNTAEAIKLIEKAINLSPKSKYYKRQLEKYKNG